MSRCQVLEGDCMDVLPTLPAESVQCVITSPPYFGLRDYGTAAEWEGGDAACDHLGPPRMSDKTGLSHPELKPREQILAEPSRLVPTPYRDTCGKCGARRLDRQLGLESTPEEYVEKLVAVFREVRRVLRSDGTVWLNLGDSYAGSWGNQGRKQERGTQRPINAEMLTPVHDGRYPAKESNTGAVPPGLKPKDLVGIPWSVAKALQAPDYIGRLKNEADRAWLAGWLDGEGTVSFVERDRGPGHTSTHDVRAYFTNSDRGPMDEFAALFGGKIYVHDDGTRENRYGSRPVFRWQMGTHDSALLVRELYPYLRTKRRQAALIWTLYTTLRHKNGHARTPPHVVARRREIADMVRTLNAGGDVTLPKWVELPPSPTEPGWYLRSAIVWAKPNPMPESVTDRPTSSYEMVFLLAKSERYYYDADSIREPYDPGSLSRYKYAFGGDGYKSPTLNPAAHPNGVIDQNPAGRNKRNVWTIATKPFADAHFATFPEDLVTPCVLAGTSEQGCCVECGAPRERVTEHGAVTSTGGSKTGARATNLNVVSPKGQTPDNAYNTGVFVAREKITTGWQPSCSCTATAKPCTVLDPFAGAGTVGVVCSKLGRDFIGIELNPEYAAMARRRIAGAPLSLFSAGVV